MKKEIRTENGEFFNISIYLIIKRLAILSNLLNGIQSKTIIFSLFHIGVVKQRSN